MSGGPQCTKCGHDRSDVHLTTIGVEFGVPFTDGPLVLNPALMEEADVVQVEAVCQACNHPRYIEHHEWEWA